MEVVRRHYSISPDKKLRKRWESILWNAVAAKRLGDDSTYEKFCNIVRTEFLTWESNAKAEAKKKSHRDWLWGGGEVYSVLAYDPLDKLDIINKCFDVFPVIEINSIIQKGGLGLL